MSGNLSRRGLKRGARTELQEPARVTPGDVQSRLVFLFQVANQVVQALLTQKVGWLHPSSR